MRSLIFAAVLTCSVSVFAQDVGDTVVVVAEKATELKLDTRVVTTIPRGGQLRVDRINGDYYWVLWKGEKGWINRKDVLSLDRALEYFTNAIRRNPCAAEYSKRGGVWFWKGENDKAIADYTEAIRLDPKDPIAYSSRGGAWYNKGENDKAIADCTEANRLDPKYAKD